MIETRVTEAEHVHIGYVIVERTERGRILTRERVIGVGPCSDGGNVHVVTRTNTGGQRTGCYYRHADVESVA